ncbi:hypothetical protein [Micromonospora coerulea]|uniref:hypothetical protein n=1 Tax=Micromonospora coerulea TaxID=47856 RepID=UPI0027DC92A7|nr:hypothetical protein [Micromonospora veneta]
MSISVNTAWMCVAVRLQWNAADVGDPVHADVVLVAAQRRWRQPRSRGDPVGEVVPDGGGDVGGHACADAAGDGVSLGQRFAALARVQEVGDLAGEGLVPAGEVEQRAGVVAFGDGGVAGIEAGAA